MDGFKGDIRFAVRTLARAPAFTLVAVLTLGLGIGANTAIFSVVDGVLLTALPYDEPRELVSVWLDMTKRDGPAREWLTPPDLEDLRDEPGLFEAMGGWGGWAPTLTGLGEPEVLTAAAVTEGTFARVLGVQPFLGRDFLPEEDRPETAGVVLLSHRFWRDRLGEDRDVLGRPLILDEEPYSIVGVMPEGFAPPFVPAAELWTTAGVDGAECGRGCYSIRSIARLDQGVSLEVARARASAVAQRLAADYPDTNTDVDVAVFALRDELVGSAGRALWVLLGAVGFVLLIACANVANLLLSRAAAREGEFAVRIALGAGRVPILRQLLVESLVLAALGGILGLTLASWGTAALVEMAPAFLPGLRYVGVDGRILAFTGVVTLGTGVVFGLVPALRASRTDMWAGVAALRAGRVGSGLRGGLVVTQVALAMVLLVGAGLLIRSFDRLTSADLGFDPEGVLTVRIALPASRFADAPARIQFFDQLLDRIGEVPGVRSVGATSSLPLAGNDVDADFRVEGDPVPEPPDRNVAWIRRVTPGYFDTMGQALLEGREFEEGDHRDAPRVAIVNEALATRHFGYPLTSPLGRRIAVGSGPGLEWLTVVSVVEDTRHFGIREDARPAIYVPYVQATTPSMTVVARTAADPLDLVADVRSAVSALDPALAASSIMPMSDRVSGAVATERFVTSLLSIFAALALILAGVGLYGVVSYSVSRRMREMGIRLALGAGSDDVQRLVVRAGLVLTAIGVVLGTMGALALTGVLEALLYDVSVTDPWTFVVMVGTLSVVAIAASWLPARRAGGADPVSIMREE